jgi:hypothetical protein
MSLFNEIDKALGRVANYSDIIKNGKLDETVKPNGEAGYNKVESPANPNLEANQTAMKVAGLDVSMLKKYGPYFAAGGILAIFAWKFKKK